MAKTTYCPFTHSLFGECALYRGRHRYLSSPKPYQGYTNESKDRAESGILPHSVDFQALRKFVEPWAGKGIQVKNEPKIRLKVIDMESAATRICEFNEAKTWDWSKPEILRVIDGRQVTSFDCLIEILCYKAEKGYQEVEIYEAPRFMLLVGG